MNTTTENQTEQINERESGIIHDALKLYGVFLKRTYETNKSIEVDYLIKKLRGKECIVERQKNRENLIRIRQKLVNV